jgi:hypothetical protein
MKRVRNAAKTLNAAAVIKTTVHVPVLLANKFPRGISIAATPLAV